ncbi:DgyrCDS10416 [Dimorphilus gyrociliatus]|nr:DgyrCDS10416 [Dimorphilus gyrociliatus]
MALAAADILFLLAELLANLNNYTDSQGFLLNVDFSHRSRIACKLIYFLRYSSKFTSTWLTVGITVERLLTVVVPLHVGSISTPTVAKFMLLIGPIITTTICIGGALSIDIIKFSNNETSLTLCMVSDKRMYELWSLIVLGIFEMIVPSLIVSICTIIILIHLRKAKKERMGRLEGQKKSLTNSTNHHKSKQSQLTFMLLLVAITFVLIRLPNLITYHSDRILKSFNNGTSHKTREESFKWLVAIRITNLFAVFNHSINFFLYCLGGSAFRKELLKIFCRRRQLNQWQLQMSSSASKQSGRKKSSKEAQV